MRESPYELTVFVVHSFIIRLIDDSVKHFDRNTVPLTLVSELFLKVLFFCLQFIIIFFLDLGNIAILLYHLYLVRFFQQIAI